ncbi:hypothetical protein ACLI4Q_06075 [Natrialbaceae archaeon A-CW1-1]
MSIDLQFYHTIYDLQGHVSGAFSEEAKELHAELKKLTKGADLALYRQHGYFFDTLETDPKTFVFGFLNVEDDHHRKEGFFDLYLIPVSEVANISLVDLKGRLERNSKSISNRHDPISETISVTVARGISPGNQRQNMNSRSERETTPSRVDRTPSPDHSCSANTELEEDAIDSEMTVEEAAQAESSRKPEERHNPTEKDDQTTSNTSNSLYADLMTFHEIADFWERYRRNQTPANTDLTEINRFVVTVSGALQHINFVSRVPDRGDPQYFEFVGVQRDNTLQVESLTERIATQHTIEQLHWDDLPTYEDDYQRKQASVKEELKSLDKYDELPENASEWLVDALENGITKYHQERAISVFEQAIEGDLVKDEEKARFGQFRSMVNRSSENDRFEAIVAEVETEALDTELKEALARELGTAIASELNETVESEVIPELQATIQKEIDEEIEVVLKETVRLVNDLQSSREYVESQ